LLHGTSIDPGKTAHALQQMAIGTGIVDGPASISSPEETAVASTASIAIHQAGSGPFGFLCVIGRDVGFGVTFDRIVLLPLLLSTKKAPRSEAAEQHNHEGRTQPHGALRISRLCLRPNLPRLLRFRESSRF